MQRDTDFVNTASVEILNADGYQSALPLAQRAAILILAVAAHAALLAQPWLTASELSASATRELSVNLIMTPVQQRTVTVPEVSTRPALQRTAKTVSSEPQHPVQQPANSEPEQVVPSGMPDAEPDYRARHLDNPQPVYPMLARRMGWQGNLVLDVEVRADGTAGEIIVQQSSGRDILDEAAMRAVRSWHFEPARRGGFPIAKHFLLPISFNLKSSG